MRLVEVFGSALALLGVVVSIQACSADSSATSESRLCTPGAYVFCRCADTSPGTKLCKDDGRAFEVCTSGGSAECKGGEIDDPDTGKDVDENGNVIPPPGEEKPPVTNDLETCPGKPTAVGGADVVITGDTTGARDDQKGKAGACIAGSGGGDHVYRIQATGTGQLSVKVQGEGALNPTVYLRSTCGDENSQIACAETTGAAGLEQLTTNVVTGREYFLVVDSASGSAGKYTVTMKLSSSSFCGDGKVDANEACDDGNKVEDDGCSNNCQNVSGNPTTGNACPGHPLTVWPGRTVTGAGSTLPYGNTFTKTGNSCAVSTNNLNAAGDHVYEVTAQAAGTLKVTLTPDAGINLMIVARTTCTDPTTQPLSLCSNVGTEGGVETISVPVTAGQKIAVAVDGAGTVNNKGTYNIAFQLQ